MREDTWKIGRMPREDRTKKPVEAITNAINHRIRIDILTVLDQAEFSTGEIAEILDEDVRYVAGHVRLLFKTGCIEFVGFRRIGGYARPVFRAVALPLITDEVFRKMSKDERHDVTGATVQSFLAELLSAYGDGKMDGTEEPPCLIWDAPSLDAKRRRKLRKRLVEVWDEEVLAAEAESANAATESGGETAPTVIGLFSFERSRAGKA